MKKLTLLGYFIAWLGAMGTGSAQYAPLTRNALPPRAGYSVYPKPVKSAIPKSRMLRKKGTATVSAPKKGGFIPLYPNANSKPTPVRNLTIPNPPRSGPASVVAPRTMSYPSLYQDPH